MLTPIIRRFYDQRALYRSTAVVRKILHAPSRLETLEYI